MIASGGQHRKCSPVDDQGLSGWVTELAGSRSAEYLPDGRSGAQAQNLAARQPLPLPESQQPDWAARYGVQPLVHAWRTECDVWDASERITAYHDLLNR